MAQLQPRTLSLSPTHHHPPHVTIPHSLCVFIEDYDLAADELFPYEEEEGQDPAPIDSILGVQR